MPISKLNRPIIEAAIVGFQQQKTQIDNQIAELQQMLDGSSAETAAMPETAPGKRKNFSAASRRKMAESQRLRWAKIKGESEPAPVTKKAPKTKRKLSAAGRKAIVAALKKRWAAKRAAAKE